MRISQPVWKIVTVLLFACLVLSGCDCSGDDTTTAFGPRCGDEVTDTGTTGGDGTGDLLLSDLANSSIREITGISTLDSAVDTDPPLTGALTRLTRPQYLTIHPTTNELIVPDEGTSAILFFSDPTNLEGNVPPDRVLGGAATELSGPVQVFVDSETDELYVLDKANSQILVYNDASTIEGEVAPNRRLGGATSAISSPSAFIFRTDTEQVMVMNPTEILTFEGYKSASGDPAPSGRYGGAATTFSNLSYGVLTSEGSLVVVDSGTDSILTFENFQFDQQNEAPTRTVSGNNTGLSDPRQFVLLSNTMYLADTGQVLVFDDLSTQEGNPFPTRKFSGLNPNTQTLTGLVVP